MNIRHALLPNLITFAILALVVILNFVSSFYGSAIWSKSLAIAVVPILLLFYFHKEKLMTNIFFVIFILSFLGIVFKTFDGFEFCSKLSESFFIGAYGLILFVMLGKLKAVKFEGLVSWYLLTVFLVNTYLMYMMFNSVKDNFQDTVILTLTVSKGVMLLGMGFLAFAIYLSRESGQSILFLTVVCCLVFSDVLGFITTMYVDFWFFAALGNILQALAFFLFCIYVYNHQQKAKAFDAINKVDGIAGKNHISV